MNYGSVSKTYSIIQLYSPKVAISKDLSDSDIVMIHEGTPLFFRRRRRSIQHHESIINWKVLSLLLILMGGLSIGIYLLIVENHRLDANFRYKLIELNAWYGDYIDSEIFSNEIKLQLPVTNVIVSHTRGNHCYTIKMCSSLINNMIQDDLADIPFNFLISDSGDSYEIRGWNYASGFPAVYNKNESIVVGFMGDFTTKMPTNFQLAELSAFINESIRRKKLVRNFKLYGIQSNDEEDLKLHDGLENMKGWKGIL
ncbi:peptidoglycan-recognition protein SC2-like [Chironomus tepperi]|uniref:peptidoglycan-recognition protein SC2-like n=1 Tax=Chironomus tepperi TaxID=113505 RepID=UPI00391EF77E